MVDSRVRFTIILLAVLVCSCARNRLETPFPGVVVKLEPDSVPFERTADATKLTVNVMIRNDRATTLHYGGCVPQVQEEINGRWQTVWNPVCIDLPMGALAPGDSSMFTVKVARFPHLQVYPQLDSIATPGRYRLQLGAVYSGPLELNRVYSGQPPPQPKLLGEITSPVFIVY